MLLMLSCMNESTYEPSAYLSAIEQDEILGRMVRYMARAPEGITPDERFYKGYDTYYREQERLHRLEAYYIDKNRKHYFLVSRIAPSLAEKRIAIGGTLTRNQAGELTAYEEVFRTWKMVPDTLAKRSIFLFDKMVKNEKLHSWYPGQSGDTEYIEFPDDRTYFDVKTKAWKTR